MSAATATAGAKPAKLFSVGQVALAHFTGWHGSRRNAQVEVKVLKVGVKWATFKSGGMEYRADACTGRIDGGQFSSPGHLWPDPAAFRAADERRRAWCGLVFKLRDTREPPAGVTSEDIARAAELLRVTP